jgi:hypothetical protein
MDAFRYPDHLILFPQLIHKKTKNLFLLLEFCEFLNEKFQYSRLLVGIHYHSKLCAFGYDNPMKPALPNTKESDVADHGNAAKPISFHPLTVDAALNRLLQVKPEPKGDAKK